MTTPANMRKPKRLERQVALVLLLISVTAGCGRRGGPGTSNEFGDAGTAFTSGVRCLPLLSAEALPARQVVTDPGAAGTGDADTYFTSVLFQRLGTYCAACHGAGQIAGFDSRSRSQDWPHVFSRIQSDDPGTPGGFMPPVNAGGKAWSARLLDPNDPLVDLVRLLQLWIGQGSPAVEFSLSSPSPADGGVPDAAGSRATASPQADYSLSLSQGAALTNIGTCLPNKYAVGINPQTMDDLDALFVQATALPDTLAETDLTTFDSDTLARNGVVSFVPAYPLWSDNAGKMRHVRPPHRQAITFDRATQQFHIPPNTRFYKTFLKPIVQADGSQAFKKIETRLIVARPDRTRPDGTVEQTALFGTYLWNENETEAVLLKDPLNDGEPFSDRTIAYVADEPRAAAIRATNPRNLEYALDVQNPGVRRHYGVPSSERCIQCHMGSPSGSFVLGFTPLQVATRPPGASGVIEPAQGDELTQLERLISYGVIAGMASPGDVTPLERSQLPRTPRNAYELAAQAYMVGNCAHCHNPRGFPSTKAPELRDVLDFLPGTGPNEGIFQFPLDRFSPTRARGLAQDVPIPYLTPSLRDIPNPVAAHPKYYLCQPEGDTGGWCTQTDKTDVYKVFIDAPWRSLIYRNVDTPFDYVDDSTIFPHMPMNTPGYDCRVPQIMGDWMVSIPATRTLTVNEDEKDASPQPYVEVKPGDPGYAAAQTAAQKRLAAYHAGRRYGYCASTIDIVDPDVESGARQTPAALPVYTGSSPQTLVMPAIGVPSRPHWVVTDATDPPGDWLPRGVGWKQALLDHVVDPNAGVSGGALVDLQNVLDVLPAVTLGAPGLRAALTTEVPFALWRRKAGCSFDGIPTAASFQGTDRPYWLERWGTAVDPAAPVYLLSPGAAVFTNICINCHGPQADAKGLLADEISIMTGGDARVANFRTGLFAPGTNRTRVFGEAAAQLGGGVTADDLGARYLAWMALGGTRKQIPPDLLGIVAVTPVAGEARPISTQQASPNMLQLARQLCATVLLSSPSYFSGDLTTQRPLDWTNNTALINRNGDAELWLKVCSLGNRPVVRVAFPQGANPDAPEAQQWNGAASTGPATTTDPSTERRTLSIGYNALYWGDAVDSSGQLVYPSDAPVLDHRGQVRSGVTSDNVVPLCLREPSDPDAHRLAETSRHVGGDDGYVIPWCPPGLFARAADGSPKWRLVTTDGSGGVAFVDASKWAARGAVNAGLAVFLYVDQLSKGLVPKPRFDQCELLPPGKAAP